MLSGRTIPNRPSKGDPDDDQRFHWSKRRYKKTDEGCSKTKNLTSSNNAQPNKSTRQELGFNLMTRSNNVRKLDLYIIYDIHI